VGIYDDLVERLERAEARISSLEENEHFLHDLISNPHLSPSQKLAMLVARDAIQKTGQSIEQLVEVDIAALGKSMGASRFTAGRAVTELAKMGGLAREARTEVSEGRNGKKKYRTRILLGLTIWTGKPASIRPTEPRNHGGKREQCEKCGGENLEVYEAYICQDCGHIHHAELKKETKGRHGRIRREELDNGHD